MTDEPNVSQHLNDSLLCELHAVAQSRVVLFCSLTSQIIYYLPQYKNISFLMAVLALLKNEEVLEKPVKPKLDILFKADVSIRKSYSPSVEPY